MLRPRQLQRLLIELQRFLLFSCLVLNDANPKQHRGLHQAVPERAKQVQSGGEVGEGLLHLTPVFVEQAAAD